MFGYATFGESAFSAAAFPIDDAGAAFLEFLGEAAPERCWLLEIDAFSLLTGTGLSGALCDGGFSMHGFSQRDPHASELTGGAVELTYSSHGFTSRAADTPASTWYDGRLTDQIRVDRRTIGRDGVGGLTQVFAEVSVVNVDGALDNIALDYALDGRPARLLLGRRGDARADYGVVVSGIVQQVSGDLQTMRFAISDGLAKLDRPIQETVYAGTDGLEGSADLAGKPKPLGWGVALNIAPPLVSSADLIYQVNDGAVQDITAVYDRGVVLVRGADYASSADMTTTAPAAGQYRVWKAGGYFRLGATPAGTVTCDLQGDASASGYITTTSAIVQRILARAGLTSTEIEPGSFFRLAAVAPATVGIWIGTDVRTIADAVDTLLFAIGAVGGFSRLGYFTVGMLDAPAGSAAQSFSTEDIIDLKVESLPAVLDPIVWRARVGYQRNHTVQTDLAASVSDARRAFAAEAQRIATKEDAALKERRLLAREYAKDGWYAEEADATAEAVRFFDLWSAGRRPYRLTVHWPALMLDISAVVDVQHPRFKFGNSRPGRVLAHSVSARGPEIVVLA